MKKLIVSIAVVTTLATGGGVYALSRDSEPYVAPAQKSEQIVETPVTSVRAVEEKPTEVDVSVEVPVVETPAPVEQEPVVEEPVDTRPKWRKFLDNKLANDPDAEIIVKCMLSPQTAGSRNTLIRTWYVNSPENGLSGGVRDEQVERVYAYMDKYLETYPERVKYCA